MNKLKLLFLTVALLQCFLPQAQIVTSEPSPLQESSKNVVIYFHADMGNKGLMNQPASAKIYAHTGVNVVTSTGAKEWQYAPTWGQNDAKYQLSYVKENVWKLEIGDMRTYYGVSANETIKKLCFVFRNADCSKEGKDTGNTDIFLDVLDNGLQVSLTSDISGTIIDASTGAVTFTVGSTEKAKLSLSVNGKDIATADNQTSLQANYTFTEPGSYKMVATAVANGVTKTAEKEYTYIQNSPQAKDTTLPAMGCTHNSDGSYTFCLAAPQKKGVILVGSWNDYSVSNDYLMEYVDHTMSEQLTEGGETIVESGVFRFFKITVPAGKINSPFSYYYLVDGKGVGDPYARLVLDPSNDKYISSEVFPNLPAYPKDKVSGNVTIAHWDETLFNYSWKKKHFNAPARNQLIIYELLLRDFTGTEGKANGNGTLKLAMEKIPYLKSLGINAIELLPVNEFNGNNSWGYNPNYYFAPDKAYGTPADYKEFIDVCHQNGIAVILDMVFNQCDWQHPWYQMYETGSNPFINASAPHAYSVLNDWNQGYPLVLRQETDCVKFWIDEYKVDGFRFDLVKGLGLNNSYGSNSSANTDKYNRSRVVRMAAINKAIRQANPKAYCINENLAGAQEENEMAADGELNWSNFNNAGCQYAMGYSSNAGLMGMWAPKAGRAVGSTVSYLESHDEERLAYKQITYGDATVKNNHAIAMQRCGSAAAQMILTPGSHMIWMFSEMGNAQTTKNSSGNDTGPKIVNWNLLDNADNKGLMQNYSELIALRLDHPELFSNAVNDQMGKEPYFFNSTSTWEKGRYIYAYNGDSELYCLINPNTGMDITFNGVPFKKNGQDNYSIVSKSYNSSPSYTVDVKRVTVPANCYVVIASKDIVGVENAAAENKDNVMIWAVDNYLHVVGATSATEVYNLSGVKVTESADSEFIVSLQPGVYVVRSGATTKKLLVK